MRQIGSGGKQQKANTKDIVKAKSKSSMRSRVLFILLKKL